MDVDRKAGMLSARSGRYALSAVLAGALAMGLVSATLAQMALTTGLGWSDDYAWYVLQAKSLVEGNVGDFLSKSVFTNTNGPSFGPTSYPWGVPLLLAPVYLFRGPDIFAMKHVNVVFLGLAAVVMFVLVRRRMNFIASFICTAAVACNPMTIWYCDMIGSDIPFMFFQMFTLALMDRHLGNKQSVASGLCVGVCAALTYAVRSNGAVLMLAFLATQVANRVQRHQNGNGRQPKNSLVAWVTPYAVFVGLLCALFLCLPPHLDHLQKPGVAYLVAQIPYHAVVLPSSYFDKLPFPLLLYGICLPFFVKGVLEHWRDDFLFILYGGMTICVYAFLPYHQGLRYALPVMPFFVYFTVRGINGTWQREGRRNAHAVLATGFAVCLVGLSARASLLMGIQNIERGRLTGCGPFDKDGREMAGLVAENTRPDSTVVFFRPRVMTLLTDRKSLSVNEMNLGRAAVADLYVHFKGVEDDTSRFMSTLEGRSLKEVFSNAHYSVYRIQETNGSR